MFRLLRLIFVLGGLGAMIWFGTTVPLGNRTLFEHIQAIWKTPESRGLVRGAKDKVGTLVDHATNRVVKGVAKNGPTAHGEAAEQDTETAPMEDLQAKDRKALRGVIEQGKVPPNAY